MADSIVLSVIYPADAGEVAVFAAHGLAESLSVMLGAEVAALAVSASAATSDVPAGPYLRLERGRPLGADPLQPQSLRPVPRFLSAAPVEVRRGMASC